MRLVEPRVVPPLDPGFCPAVLAHHALVNHARESGEGEHLVLALERSDGQITTYGTALFPPGHSRFAEGCEYAALLVKDLLWMRGGWRVVVGGPTEVGQYVQRAYAPGGEFAFEAEFMGGVYQQPFTVEVTTADEAPGPQEGGMPLGRHLEGCRIGLDLGASDYKLSAVVEGEAVWTEEFPWDPRPQSDPSYHYEHLMDGLKQAAAHLPRLDAIGVSAAGIYLNNRVAVASLFRGIPPEVFDAQVRDLFLRIQKDWGGIPLEVANDGDVTALAGSMSLEASNVLGIALGSSEAGGYVDGEGNITGWLNELAFVPFDYQPGAASDDWSHYPGVGSQYLCQVGAARMAPWAGIELDPALGLPEKLKAVQELMAAGDERARRVYETLGVWTGYAIALYADFYNLEHVLVLGRVTSGEGGTILRDTAQHVLREEFPELGHQVKLHLPEETERRHGQAVAAASLPALSEED